MRRSDFSLHSRRRSIIAIVTERERQAGHPDGPCRADLLDEIDDEIDLIGLTRWHACIATGIVPGGLDDSSVSTDRLREVLATLRQWPGEVLFRRLRDVA